MSGLCVRHRHVSDPCQQQFELRLQLSPAVHAKLQTASMSLLALLLCQATMHTHLLRQNSSGGSVARRQCPGSRSVRNSFSCDTAAGMTLRPEPAGPLLIAKVK